MHIKYKPKFFHKSTVYSIIFIMVGIFGQYINKSLVSYFNTLTYISLLIFIISSSVYIYEKFLFKKSIPLIINKNNMSFEQNRILKRNFKYYTFILEKNDSILELLNVLEPHKKLNRLKELELKLKNEQYVLIDEDKNDINDIMFRTFIGEKLPTYPVTL